MAKKVQEQTPTECFETALEQLAEIVSALEDGSIGLEESLARFEEGMRLLRHCHEVLARAERRIEQLIGFDVDGNPITESLDGAATIEQRKESPGRRHRTKRTGSDFEEENGPDTRLF